MLKLSVSISRVSVEGLKLVILSAYLFSNCLGKLIFIEFIISSLSNAFRQMEEVLMRKTRLTRSGCYKVAMEDFYLKHFPRR